MPPIVHDVLRAPGQPLDAVTSVVLRVIAPQHNPETLMRTLQVNGVGGVRSETGQPDYVL